MPRFPIVLGLVAALVAFPGAGVPSALAATDDGDGQGGGTLTLVVGDGGSPGAAIAADSTPTVVPSLVTAASPPGRCDLTATPSAIATSLQERALERINCYRALAGVASLTLDDALNRAAAAHVGYYVQNFGDPSLAGMGLHEETSGRPGFTGADSDARAKAAGSNDWYVDENVGLAGASEATVDWFVNSVNHRENLLHPAAVHLGYASSTNPPIDVFDIGIGNDPPSVPLPTTYPGDHQQGVPTSVDLAETPDPAPGVPRPLGYPVTISFDTRDTVAFSAYQISDQAGQ